MPKFRRKKTAQKIDPGSLLEVEQAVLDTLCYRSVFNYPMSIHQLGTFLISEKKFDGADLKKGISGLQEKGIIKSKSGKYYLKGQKPVGWEYRKKMSKQLLKEAAPVIGAAGKIPWIKMISVTGSVAAFNAGKNDDVDIFIVTEKNRVWLSRFFAVLIFKILGKYRSDTDSERKLCPNLFVDESRMRWEENSRNSYIAHEIAMMAPVVDKDETYTRFLSENDWISGFLANFEFPRFSENYKTRRSSAIVDFLENLLMKAQILYMLRKRTSELVDKNFIHFNRDDSSDSILSGFGQAKKKVFT